MFRIECPFEPHSQAISQYSCIQLHLADKIVLALQNNANAILIGCREAERGAKQAGIAAQHWTWCAGANAVNCQVNRRCHSRAAIEAMMSGDFYQLAGRDLEL